MLLLILFAFLSGVATILSPCIWPILPVVLSSSSQGGKLRPFGISLGIITSFALFTLTISTLVKILNFDPNVLRNIAIVLIAILGLAMLIPKLNQYLEILISKLTSKFGGAISNTQNGFVPGFVTGFVLGAVWSPCAGPILASVAALAATSQVSLSAVIITIAYVLGIGIPLFFIGYGGQQLITKSRGISKYTGKIQQAFGIVMILTAAAIYFNFDQTIQLKLLEKFPQLDAGSNLIESNPEIKNQLDKLGGIESFSETKDFSLQNYGAAPEFAGITNWINTENGDPLTMEQLKGKVVLIDFWTYTCINCIRTLPHVTSWYEKYKDQDFIVVGVHTPEFAFEKETTNVINAAKKYNINYPIAQDNDYGTWRAYQNRYWPAKYLIDANGDVRYVHFGEGEYEETEEAIRQLIEENGRTVSESLDSIQDTTPQNRLTPETYLGSARMEYYAPSGRLESGTYNLEVAQNIPRNSFTLGGKWNVQEEYSESLENSALEMKFKANKVFLVMKPSDAQNPKSVKIFLDGAPLSIENSSEDVNNGSVNVNVDRLYTLVQIQGPISEHRLRLEFESGIQSYAFTFGD